MRFLQGVFIGAALLAGGQAAIAKSLTIVITKVQCVDPCRNRGLESDLESAPDFYAKVWVNNPDPEHPSFTSPRAPDDQESVEPFWTYTAELPDDLINVPIGIQIWDYDSSSGDDLGDASPLGGGDNNLDFMYNMTDGRWFGDVNSPQSCSEGGGGDEPRVRVCFAFGGDADGDGLLDSWETNGLDFDGDGTIDVNLPLMGADPGHKDLYLEIDYVAGQAPTRAAIQAMKLAFANAPVNAGGIRNPDGKPGINLHVDVGMLVDPTAAEGPGQPAGSCNDGIDNDNDGPKDGLDSRDCWVGDNLGPDNLRGNSVPGYFTCGLDRGFYDVKWGWFSGGAPNFDLNRKWVFRYAVSAQQGSPCSKPSGGEGELGGNDFTDFNHDGGTIMHELGHNLRLNHGGNVKDNCRPNYVSVMNYDNQSGIRRAKGNSILDYSPPRRSDTAPASEPPRGAAPLPLLDENSLSETTVLDPSDNVNWFVFTDFSGAKVQGELNQPVDWDSTFNFPFPAPTRSFNIDVASAGPDGGPQDCKGNTALTQFGGFDDWSVISLPFRQFGDAVDGAINPTGPEISLDELKALETALNTTDLSVSKTDTPDPVAAGTNLVYTLGMTNNGPNPARRPRLMDTLPSGVTHVSNSANCAVSGNTLTCDLPEMLSHGSGSATATVFVARDLVHNAGGPVNIVNHVSISNSAGPDPNASNNSASATTRVVAVGDLKIVNFSAFNAPAEIIVGQPVTLTMRKTITNLGPSAPMDAKLTRTATAPPDAVISPVNSTSTEPAVGLNEQRVVDETFSLTCNGYSHHLFSFTNEIQPARPDDTDPDQSNNKANASVDIECVVPVRINIQPGGFPNSYNMSGQIAVAVLSTAANEYGLPLSFDATRIDPLSVRFGPQSVFTGGGASEVHAAGHIENAVELDEKTRDGDLDMVLHFRADQTGLVVGQQQGCIKGTWRDAQNQPHKFFGCDSISLSPK